MLLAGAKAPLAKATLRALARLATAKTATLTSGEACAWLATLARPRAKAPLAETTLGCLAATKSARLLARLARTKAPLAKAALACLCTAKACPGTCAKATGLAYLTGTGAKTPLPKATLCALACCGLAGAKSTTRLLTRAKAPLTKATLARLTTKTTTLTSGEACTGLTTLARTGAKAPLSKSTLTGLSTCLAPSKTAARLAGLASAKTALSCCGALPAAKSRALACARLTALAAKTTTKSAASLCRLTTA